MRHSPLDGDSTIADMRTIWEAGQVNATIAIIDGAQNSDREGTRCAIICSIGNGGPLIRCALSKQEAINLSRALIEVVS